MNVRLMLLLLIAMLACTALAHATVITYQNSVTFATVGTNTLLLPRFDSSLGGLNSITVFIYGTGQATFAADNDYGDGSIDVTANMQHSFLVTAPGVSTNGDDSWSNTVTLAPDNGDAFSMFDPSGVDGYSWGTITNGEYATAGSPVTVGNPFFAAYTGPGNVTFNVNSQAFTSEINGSAPWFSGANAFYLSNQVSNPSLQVRVQVAYDYTENANVPEPTTLALLGMGICGVGWRARRRRVSKA